MSNFKTVPPFPIIPVQSELDTFPIMVLLIDDQKIVGERVKQILEGENDISFHFCENPHEGIEKAKSIKPTVILLDLLMPGVDGLDLVKQFRKEECIQDIPMIVLSSREEPDIKQKAFEFGANDYIVKLPDSLEIIARIRYHSRAYINRLERDRAYKALLESQALLKAELAEAERYVKSLLPDIINEERIQSDWYYASSTELGGDSFGYHWIDDNHFAIYLLDVCGHGVGAALLSVSVINVLRTQSLADVNFFDPASVLTGLNEAFQMKQQNEMFFTIWYGVFNFKKRELSYSTGGHPPAILISEENASLKSQKLKTPGLVVGIQENAKFEVGHCKIDPGNRLYIFSDGVYEIDKTDGSGLLTMDAFITELMRPHSGNQTKVRSIVAFIRNLQGCREFNDDFSLLEICFK